ncbi:hypothetical protein T459_02342 [Capsicum annuum]|uniref:Ribosomal protein L15 n=1 Tax=Capsicum annuum TaxID=4072 RepID=A0A2G3AJS8_CAPAN|nr:hypothetical protein T459_02342 [Capsicum annuum]
MGGWRMVRLIIMSLLLKGHLVICWSGFSCVVGVDQALRFTSQYRFLHFMVLGRRVVNTLYKLSSYVVSLTCVLMEVYDFDKLTLGLEHRVVVDFGMWELGVEGNFVGYYRHDVVCDSVIVSARYQDFEVIGMIQIWAWEVAHGCFSAGSRRSQFRRASNDEDQVGCSGAISWKSSKQTCIAHSTMEFEFIALVLAGQEAGWLRNFLADVPLWGRQVSSVSLHCDSQTGYVVYRVRMKHGGRKGSFFKGAYTCYVGATKKQSDVMSFLQKVRCWEYHQQPSIVRVTKSTRPDKARRLGLQGQAFSNEQYQEPLEMHGGGRGGRGCERGESQILRQRQMMTQLDSMSQFITISFCSSLVVTYTSHSLTIEVPVCWDSLVKLVSWFYSGELPRPISGYLWDNPNKKEKLHE